MDATQNRKKDKTRWLRREQAKQTQQLPSPDGDFYGITDAEAIYSYEGTNDINTLIVGQAITGMRAAFM